jgi:hypothetical protein
MCDTAYTAALTALIDFVDHVVLSTSALHAVGNQAWCCNSSTPRSAYFTCASRMPGNVGLPTHNAPAAAGCGGYQHREQGHDQGVLCVDCVCACHTSGGPQCGVWRG